MAESFSEIDVLNHLLEVEKDASLLIDQAVEDSTKKVSAAKAKANAQLQEKVAQIQKQMEADFQSNVESVQKSHDSLLEDYKNQLATKSQNKKQFNSLLKDLFAAAK